MPEIEITEEVNKLLDTIIEGRGAEESFSEIIHEALAYAKTYLLHTNNRITCPHCHKKIPKWNQGHCIFCHKPVSKW